MKFEAINIPVWKTRDYILDVAKIHGVYRIYLKRLGKFYMKNEHGIKVKFSAKDAKEDEFYTKVFKENRAISTGLISVTSG